MINNYLKISILNAEPTDDSESFNTGLRKQPNQFCTTWVFPFNDKSRASSNAALAAAQEKRARLQTKHYTLAPGSFQLASFAPSGIRGVPVVGEPIRKLPRLVETEAA